MSLTDKELALRFLGFAEDLIFQSSIHQLLLNQHVPDWQNKYQSILERCGPQTKELIHQSLEATWTQTFEAPDLSTVVKRLVEDIERNDPK
jgi:hypothetical protein